MPSVGSRPDGLQLELLDLSRSAFSIPCALHLQEYLSPLNWELNWFCSSYTFTDPQQAEAPSDAPSFPLQEAQDFSVSDPLFFIFIQTQHVAE